MFNFTRFFDLDPLKVYSLDVVAQQYILGNSVFDGILNWKTYKPALTNYDFAESTLIINYEGLQLHREFYTPIYETNDQFESHLPDFRNVLQWEPGIFLNGKLLLKVIFILPICRGDTLWWYRAFFGRSSGRWNNIL